jgi:hypothetical protein
VVPSALSGLAHYSQTGKRKREWGKGTRPHPLAKGAAMRALEGPTSRPGRRRPRCAGARGWPWLRDPGLGGRVINSPAGGRLLRRPRAPHCQLQPTPDPGRPGPGAPTWPGLPPAGGGSGPRGPGGGERVEGAVGGGLAMFPKPGSSRACLPSAFPSPGLGCSGRRGRGECPLSSHGEQGLGEG